MNQIHILFRLTGEYADYVENPIRAYASLPAAEADRASLEEWLKAHEDKLREAYTAGRPLAPPPLDLGFSTDSRSCWEARWRVDTVDFVP